MGEGGGCCSALGVSASPALPLLEPAASCASADDMAGLELERPLVADLTLRASDLSSFDSTSAVEDARGLSLDLEPGILVLRALLNERIDSLVSDLLKDGYESRLGPPAVGVCDPVLLFPSFDG